MLQVLLAVLSVLSLTIIVGLVVGYHVSEEIFREINNFDSQIFGFPSFLSELTIKLFLSFFSSVQES